MRRTMTLLALGLTLPLVACDRGRPAGDEEAQPVQPPAASAPAATSPAAPTTPPAPAPATPETPPGTSGQPSTVTLPSSPLASSPADIQRMPVTEAASLRDSGQAVFVDVRDLGSYNAEHVEGAVHLPLGELASRAAELPRDKVIVAYCA